MTPLDFYAWSGAWLFLLVVPLVLFYFLKLKRPRLQVPSLVLWRQVLRDRRVNSPFQRFKRNILLLLQLLLLVLLILAAMQPFWRGRAARVRRIAVLIDSSASMAALEGPRGASRLDLAKAEVNEIIAGPLPDQQICLISFSRTARKRTDFTNDKRALREALEGIQVEHVPSSIEDALRMTQGLAQGVPLDEVLLFTDGNFPARAHFDLSFKLDYQRLPAAGPNFGITSLNARRWMEGSWDVFIYVEGSQEAEGPVTIELNQDGEVVGTEHVSLRKGEGERLVFRVSGQRPSSLKATLMPEGFDSLSCDNVAYLDLPAIRALQVYVPKSLVAYRHALSALKGVSLHTEDEADSAFDLVVSDRREDLAVEGRTCCYVGLVPEELEPLVRVEQGGSSAVDWSRNSSLLSYVDFNDLIILDRPVSLDGVSEGDYENLGYEVLVHGEHGPLLLQKREGDKLLFYLLFHTDRSTLPYRIGFPVMVSNLVQVAMEQAGLSEVHGVRTGVLPELSVRPNRVYRIEGPDGGTRSERSDEAGLLSGVPAPRVGRYKAWRGGRVAASVGVGLLCEGETGLESVEKIQFKEDLSVAASAGGARMDRALWRIFAMVGLCVLLGEWWYFQRKPGGG